MVFLFQGILIAPVVASIAPFFFPYLLYMYNYRVKDTQPHPVSFGVSRRSQNSKLEAKSDVINNNGEFLLKLPDGRTQLLKIQTDNFGNLARVQTIGAPREKRETFSPLFKPSLLNLYTKPHLKSFTGMLHVQLIPQHCYMPQLHKPTMIKLQLEQMHI